jgi:Single domain von Willebrand factor type C
MRPVCIDGVCENYCVIQGYNIKPGQSVKTSFCSELHCRTDFSGTGESCGIASSDKCKRYDPDYNFEYPECCNRICIPKDED